MWEKSSKQMSRSEVFRSVAIVFFGGFLLVLFGASCIPTLDTTGFRCSTDNACTRGRCVGGFCVTGEVATTPEPQQEPAATAEEAPGQEPGVPDPRGDERVVGDAGEESAAPETMDAAGPEEAHTEPVREQPGCLPNQYQKTLINAHEGLVTGIARFPDSLKLLATSSYDGTIRLWNLPSFTESKKLTGAGREFSDVAVSSNGAYLAGASWGGDVWLWDLRVQDTPPRRLKGHNSQVHGVDFHPKENVLASVGLNKALILWDAKTGAKLTQTLNAHTNIINTVAFDPTGTYLATVSHDNMVKVWEVKHSGTSWSIALAQSASVGFPATAVAWHPKGEQLAVGLAGLSGGTTNAIRLWNHKTNTFGTSLIGHQGPIHSVQFDAAGTSILSASVDQSVRIWNIQTGVEERSYTAHKKVVRDALWLHLGKEIVSVDGTGGLKHWERATGKTFENDYGHTATVRSVAFDPSSQRLLSGSEDGTVKLWSRTTGKLLHTFWGHTGNVNAVAFLPVGDFAVSGGQDGLLRVWDLTRLEENNSYNLGASIISLAFNNTGGRLAIGTVKGELIMFNATARSEIWRIKAHLLPTYGLTWSTDQKAVVTGSPDKNIKFWAAHNGDAAGSYVANNQVYTLTFSPRGGMVAIGLYSGDIDLYDTAQQSVVRSLKGHKAPIWQVAFSPQGKRLVSASVDATLRLWDVDSGQTISTKDLHKGAVRSIATSPDGRWFASGSADRRILLWGCP